MVQSVFHDLVFAAFVLLTMGLPLAGLAVAGTARTLPRWLEMAFGMALVAAAGTSAVALRELHHAVLATPSLVDDTVFRGRWSAAIYILPAALAAVGAWLLASRAIAMARGVAVGGAATPASASPYAGADGRGEVGVVVLALLAMLVIFATDSVTSTDIRLHVLYVFPLAAVAARCTRLRAVVAVLGLAIVLQLANIAADNAALGPFLIDSAVDIAASVLVAVLGRRGRRAYLRVEELARTDPLTGLVNRRCLLAALDAQIARQRRHGGVFALTMLDLDGFKQLNDSRGHAAGDEALQRVATVLRAQLRQIDEIGRIGGDEFAVVMGDIGMQDLADKCESLRAAIAQDLQAHSLAVTASIGGKCFLTPPADAGQALASVDAAMYAAKQAGRNRVVCE